MKPLMMSLLLALSMVLLVPASGIEAGTLRGDWTMREAREPDQVQVSLSYSRRGGESRHSSQWHRDAFEGLDTSRKGREEVRFSTSRKAGRFEFEGYFSDSEGTGLFNFFPDPDFAQRMSSLGFNLDEDRQFQMAVQDVSLEFARQMKAAHLAGLDSDRLIAFRIHGVDLTFIEALRATGRKVEDSENLIAFRVHEITPELVRALKRVGYSPADGLLIASKIHGATPQWIETIQGLGFKGVDLEKLIAFREHEVSPDFIESFRNLGYAGLAAEQLIAFRVHQATPAYILALRDLGLEPTANEIIELRVHQVTPEYVRSLGPEGTLSGVRNLIESKIRDTARRPAGTTR